MFRFDTEGVHGTLGIGLGVRRQPLLCS
jgi:hypothetical protein